MWKWLENLFYNKALITPELVAKDEELRQCYDDWMDDRSQLNGARLELKTAREKIEELEDLVKSKDKKTDHLLWVQNTVNTFKDTQIEAGNKQRKEMQERIDELENEVYSLTVELKETKARFQNLVNQI